MKADEIGPAILISLSGRSPQGFTSNLGNHPRLSLGAVRRRRPGGET